MGKIITVLEAAVAKDKQGDLVDAYRILKEKPAPQGLVRSSLVQDSGDAKIWQIITVWKNREALQKMKASGETPGGVLVFREANAEPTLSIYETKEEI